MLSTKGGVTEALDKAIVIFLTAVTAEGQPQTSPVWFIRDGDEIVVYNRPDGPRLTSISSNDRVALNLRGDRGAGGMLSLEGRAAVDHSLPSANESEVYVRKYGSAMVKVSGSSEAFALDYSVGVRIAVTKVRVWGIQRVIEAESGSGD